MRSNGVDSMSVPHRFLPVLRSAAKTIPLSPAMYTVSSVTAGEGVSIPSCRCEVHTRLPVLALYAWRFPSQSPT